MALTVGIILGMAPAVEPRGKRWQYPYEERQWVKFGPINRRDDEPQLVKSKVLNDLGNDGWEMVQTSVGGYLFGRSERQSTGKT